MGILVSVSAILCSLATLSRCCIIFFHLCFISRPIFTVKLKYTEDILFSLQQRSNLLRRWYELIIENQEELGKLITVEMVSVLYFEIKKTKVVYMLKSH